MTYKKIIFVDASAWIAIVFEKDQFHQIASKIYQRELGDSLLLTSNWTTYEAYSMIKKKGNLGKVLQLQNVIKNKSIVKLERVSKKIKEEAVDIFFSYADKKWGIVDISSFVIMRRASCKFAFAFDEHFVEAAKQNGFEMLTI
jgi:predicted nucleic acid-binding protein